MNLRSIKDIFLILKLWSWATFCALRHFTQFYSYGDQIQEYLLTISFNCLSDNWSCGDDLYGAALPETGELGSDQSQGNNDAQEEDDCDSTILQIVDQYRKSQFECSVCHKTYKNKGSLQRHIKFECLRRPQQLCPYCPHLTNYRHDLKKHIQQKHKY